ncbi:hypothetical protein CRG98_024233 [Punica granatum]|uniref:Uncharacterized protein n=1 Tax=Punica granatum TaxID=22663 RepID=A0A2I0JGJ9_PUNGR|nr:hypothetical protein CRG98_024233 [Punica granatum]
MERLEEEFAAEWRAESSGYSRKFVEECVGKEKEEKKRLVKVPQENDEVPLFYSDLVPLLVREEAEEVEIAKATVEGLKDEGIGDSAMVLMELLKPLKGAIPRLQETLTWERPLTTLAVLCSTILVLYKEWVNKAVAAFSLWLVVKMLQARKRRSQHWQDEIVVCTASVQSTMESIVSAQKGLQTVHAVVQAANIALLKLWSIFVSRAPKHADAAMVALSVSAMVLAVIPLKYILMGVTVYSFAMNSRMRKHIESDRGNRRLKEWWDSIPVVPVRVADKAKNCPKK